MSLIRCPNETMGSANPGFESPQLQASCQENVFTQPIVIAKDKKRHLRDDLYFLSTSVNLRNSLEAIG